LATRGHRLACIFIWEDSLGVDYTTIEKKLADDYGWTLGTRTIQKLYYQERKRVYDTHWTTGDGAGSDMGGTITVKEAVNEGSVHDMASKAANPRFAGAQIVCRH
jgi:hypothetical protein